MLARTPLVFGDVPTTADAAIYGFVASILSYPIDTPLRDYVVADPDLVQHCHEIHRRCGGAEVRV